MLQDPQGAFNWTAYLDFYQNYNLNFIRLWTVEWAHDSRDPADRFTEPLPYPRTGPGLALDGRPKFDLDQFDESYFGKVRDWSVQAGSRGIYVSYMFFDGFGDE